MEHSSKINEYRDKFHYKDDGSIVCCAECGKFIFMKKAVPVFTCMLGTDYVCIDCFKTKEV